MCGSSSMSSMTHRPHHTNAVHDIGEIMMTFLPYIVYYTSGNETLTISCSVFHLPLILTTELNISNSPQTKLSFILYRFVLLVFFIFLFSFILSFFLPPFFHTINTILTVKHGGGRITLIHPLSSFLSSFLNPVILSCMSSNKDSLEILSFI